MRFLKWALVLVLLLSPVADQRDLSLHVQQAASPAHPHRTLATGLVVAEIIVNPATGAVQTRALHGETPFLISALDSLMRWRFSAAPGAVQSRTSITFLFRSPVPYSVELEQTAIRPWMPGEDCPALPQKVIDPLYPMGSEAEGAVILEVGVSAEGAVTHVETVNGIDDLTEHAKAAVRDWKFSPALLSGKPVASTAYVVISFVAPM
jgi:TonB family protein